MKAEGVLVKLNELRHDAEDDTHPLIGGQLFHSELVSSVRPKSEKVNQPIHIAGAK